MLSIHTAERVEPLAEHLAGVLAVAPPDPLTRDWVAVPSEGMRRWLALELARHLGAGGPDRADGVAANIEMPFPAALRARVLEADSEPDPAGTGDPWAVDRLVWAVLAVLGRSAADASLRPLATVPDGSRYARARRVADLFDRYHVHRPAMVRAWATGRDVDGTGRPLAAHHRWQPHLWRLVRSEVGVPSPAERLPDLLARLAAGDLVVDLPDRIALFGLARLPGGASFLDLARALGAARDVHAYLLEPSGALVAAVRSGLGPPTPGAARSRADDPTADLAAHPLLRSWGRLAREAAALLADADAVAPLGIQRLSEPDPGPSRSGTLLGRLQADLRRNVAPVPDLRPAPGDRSVEIHACHGVTRQVEVLRDLLLHLLAEAPPPGAGAPLTEDDILVVCPALDRFAPVLAAVFGPSADTVDPAAPGIDGPPALRYRLTDRSLRRSDPMLAAADALLALVGGRVDAVALVDLLALGPVRRRYGFSDADLGRIAEWIAAANVRWGLDGAHRERFGVPAAIRTNTWEAALDRLLVGAAVADDEPALAVGDVVPLGIEGDDVGLAGRLADLLARVGALAGFAAAEHPVDRWLGVVRDAAGALFAAPPTEGWQLEALHRVLADVADAASRRGEPAGTPLALVDVRRLLADRLGGRPGRPDFFRGGITITSMVPLRDVPFQVVCLLGADQPALGGGVADGDDLVAAAPVFGDPDRRGELRQALLELVLTAGDRLVVVRDGHDPRTNQVIPPAVAVAELRDGVLAAVHPDAHTDVAAQLEVAHPHQGFDERCFAPGEVVGTGPWGFDPVALDAAGARRRRTTGRRSVLTAPLAPTDTAVVDLADLHRFLARPAPVWFFEHRLQARLPRDEDEPAVALPVDLGPLERYAVGDRLLAVRRRGGSVEEWHRIERRLGLLPPGVLGRRDAAAVQGEAEVIVSEAERRGVRGEPRRSVPIDVVLADGTRVIGTVDDLLDPASPGAARVRFVRGGPRHRLAAALDLVALLAADPTVPWRSVAVLRGHQTEAPFVIDLRSTHPHDADRARAAAVDALEAAVECLRRGEREPLPLFPGLSHAVFTGERGAREWGAEGRGEGVDPWVVAAFGPLDVDDMCALEATDTDPPGPGGRVERYARRLWAPIAAAVADAEGDDHEAPVVA